MSADFEHQLPEVLAIEQLHQRFRDHEEQDEELTDYGLEGADPDCHIFGISGVTTMVWLKSHHLIDLSKTSAAS